jgi:transposase
MNDIERLQTENARLKESLALKDSQLVHANSQLSEANSQHQAVVAEFTESLNEKDRTVRLLERQIEKLLRQIRGSRQERIDPDQLMLFSVEELQQLADELRKQDEQGDSSSTGNGKPKRKGHGRRKLPEHLPREVIRHELDESDLPCPCCGELREAFGVETSEQLEFVPAKWKVIQHDRVKYACRACGEHVAVAEKPPQPIEKGFPAAGLCAHTTLSKFGDHQPLYRLEDIHSR